MTVFECEDSSDGIFTGIYDAWASRLGHANVRLQLQGMHTLELFTQYRQVVPDAGKAEKVARTIRRKMGEESYQIIFRAAMAKSGEKADCIYRTLVQGLSSHISEKEAAAILEHLTDPAICKVFELSRRVWHEAHHYMGFVRFSELKNGVHYDSATEKYTFRALSLNDAKLKFVKAETGDNGVISVTIEGTVMSMSTSTSKAPGIKTSSYTFKLKPEDMDDDDELFRYEIVDVTKADGAGGQTAAPDSDKTDG